MRINSGWQTIKRKKAAALLFCLLPAFVFFGCGGNGEADGGAFFHEAYAKAEEGGSVSWYESHLVFDFGEALAPEKREFSFRSDTVYRKDPFGLYAIAVSSANGEPGASETYTTKAENGFWIYSKNGESWVKNFSDSIDTAPEKQLELLDLLSRASTQSFLREEEKDGVLCRKLEITFSGEALRDIVETIVTASGMDAGGTNLSELLVESLSNREDQSVIRGYCWIEKDTGLLRYVEIDAKEILQKAFGSIDGAEIGVTIEACEISGGFTEIGNISFPELPEGAADASSAEAVG